MKKAYKKIKRHMRIMRERWEYFREKSSYVYICMVDYSAEPFVHFGRSSLKEAYEEEKELKREIYKRKLVSGRTTYITYDKGEYHMIGYNLLTSHERCIIVYRPRRWSLRSRDEMLADLFITANIAIKVSGEMAEEEYEKGKVSLKQFNERLRKSNVAKFEIEKLMDIYCYTGI